MRVCLYIGIILTAVTIICTVVAVALPYWLYDDSTVKRYEGLWVECKKSEATEQCKYKFVPPQFIDAVRSMMCFGIAFCIISLILGLIYACVKRQKTRLGVAAMILVFLGGVFLLVGVIVYVSKYTMLTFRNNMTLHSAFGIAVVSTVLAFISAMSYCVSHIREEYDD